MQKIDFMFSETNHTFSMISFFPENSIFKISVSEKGNAESLTKPAGRQMYDLPCVFVDILVVAFATMKYPTMVII